MDDHHKTNGARLSHLIIDVGTQAMKNVFDSIHPPHKLKAVLSSNRGLLRNLRCIGTTQMNILFPSGDVEATSADFDITLLFVLLRQICGLNPPSSTGSWDANPPSTDSSQEANLARIKYYRNVVYGHVTTTGIDDVRFEDYWHDISNTLSGLGISDGDIEKVKLAPLEEKYVQHIKEWKEKEDKLEVKLEAIHVDVRNGVSALRSILKELQKQSNCNITLNNIKKQDHQVSGSAVRVCQFCESSHEGNNKKPRCYTV